MPPKRKSLTVEEKFNIVSRLKMGATNVDLCKEFGLTSSTVSTIWKCREKIMDSFQADNTKTKRLRCGQFEDVDEALLLWFKIHRSNSNVPINGPILLEKARAFAVSFNHNSEPDASWLQRFRKRHNIVLGTVSGEFSSVPTESRSREEWLETVWPKLREGYSDDEIFNGDETGLFFKLMPNKTYKFKGEKCSCGKMSKDRLTVMVAANMTGTEKRKLLVIGKSRNPRRFKNVKTERLPVSYASNQKAWMTSRIFEEYLREWDEELKRKKKKILLLVDNLPAHPKVENMKTIKLAFLPPNTTSIQPMDQGIIKSMKTNYRKRAVIRRLKNIDENQQSDINVLDAIHLVSKAWDEVTETTVRNCFRRAGLQSADERSGSSDERQTEDDVNEWAQDLGLPPDVNVEDFNEYISVDDDLAVSGEMTDQEIVASVQGKRQDVEDEIDEDEDNSEDEEPPPPVSLGDASRALTLVCRFLSSKSEVPIVVDEAVTCVENFLDSLYFVERKQSKMTDFFTNA